APPGASSAMRITERTMPDDALDVLEQRVARLERQAARGRAIGIGGLGALALALLLIAAAPRASSAPGAGGGAKPLTVVEPFVVEDSAGNPIATFGGGSRSRVDLPDSRLVAFQSPMPIPNAPVGERPAPIPLSPPDGTEPDAGLRTQDNS